jgi:phosphatidate cytidylyltransferase
LKRDFGIKDMSSFLPGHGGMFDRIDSATLTAPALWIFLELTKTLS